LTPCRVWPRRRIAHFTTRECIVEYFRSRLSVCNAPTFESLGLESSCLVCRYTFRISSQVRIGHDRQGHRSKKNLLGIKSADVRRGGTLLITSMFTVHGWFAFNWMEILYTFYHPRSEAACVILLVVYYTTRVCRPYVCLSETITFESLDVGSSFSHMRYIFRRYGSSLYMKVIGSRSRSQEPKGRKSLFHRCKTSIGNNSTKHTAMKFACSMGFLNMGY